MTDYTRYLERYAALGFNVIPVTAGDKTPAVSSWLTYQRRLSTDAERALWWQSGIPHSLAVVTGEISGNLAVIDCDDMDTARDVIARLPPTMTVQTGHGMHVYVRLESARATIGFRLRGKLHHVRCGGAYVVAPPSIHPSGAVYRFVDDLDPVTLAPEAVAEMLEAIGAQSGATGDVQGPPVAGWVANLLSSRVAEGERHDSFARLAGYLSGKLHMDETCAIMRLWMAANMDGYENLPEYRNPEHQVRAWYQQRQ